MLIGYIAFVVVAFFWAAMNYFLSTLYTQWKLDLFVNVTQQLYLYFDAQRSTSLLCHG